MKKAFENSINQKAEFIYNLMRQSICPLNYIDQLCKEIGQYFDQISDDELCADSCYVRTDRGEAVEFYLSDGTGADIIDMSGYILKLNQHINYYPHEEDHFRCEFDRLRYFNP